MARKKISSYFPENDEPVYVGGYIPKSLKAKVLPILKARKLQQADIIRAAFEIFLDENLSNDVPLTQLVDGGNKYKKS